MSQIKFSNNSASLHICLLWKTTSNIIILCNSITAETLVWHNHIIFNNMKKIPSFKNSVMLMYFVVFICYICVRWEQDLQRRWSSACWFHIQRREVRPTTSGDHQSCHTAANTQAETRHISKPDAESIKEQWMKFTFSVCLCSKTNLQKSL